MSTRQDNSNTNGALSQEQLNNARKLWKRLDRPGDDIPSDVNDIGDIGALKGIAKDLLHARIEAGLDGLYKVAKALKSDYPILDELRKESRYKPISISALLAMPEQKWILRNFLYEDAITVVYGAPGSAKSFLTLDWAVCLALGKPWQGRDVQQCRVLYLAAEGVRGYQRRLLAHEYHFETDLERLEKYMAFIPCPVPLANTAEVEEFTSAILDYLDGAPADGLPLVIILDTIFQCTAGQNINQPEVMSGLVASVQKVKEETKAAHVVLVHHSGKDKERGMFGGQALKASTDISYCVEIDKENNVTLTSDKVKDDEATQAYLYLQKVTYGDGLRDNSCVLLHRDKPDKAEVQNGAHRAMLLVLPDVAPGLAAQGWMDALNKQYSAGTSAPFMSRSAFYAHLKTLKEKELIVNVGTESKPLYLRKSAGDDDEQKQSI